MSTTRPSKPLLRRASAAFAPARLAPTITNVRSSLMLDFLRWTSWGGRPGHNQATLANLLADLLADFVADLVADLSVPERVLERLGTDKLHFGTVRYDEGATMAGPPS